MPKLPKLISNILSNVFKQRSNKYEVYKIETKNGINKNTGYTSDFLKWHSIQEKIAKYNKTALPYTDLNKRASDNKDVGNTDGYQIKDGPFISNLIVGASKRKEHDASEAKQEVERVKFLQLINDNSKSFYDSNKIPPQEKANITKEPFSQMHFADKTQLNNTQSHKKPPVTNPFHTKKNTTVNRGGGLARL